MLFRTLLQHNQKIKMIRKTFTKPKRSKKCKGVHEILTEQLKKIKIKISIPERTEQPKSLPDDLKTNTKEKKII